MLTNLEEAQRQARIREIRRLEAENERLRAAHQDIVRKYEQVMEDPPEWTNFKGDQLTWVREAWYGAAKISRKALANGQSAAGSKED